MGLFSFLKRKREQKKEVPEPEAPMDLTGIDLSGAETLETRYTQEYQDFLARQEAEAARGDVQGETDKRATPVPETEAGADTGAEEL